ncbi:unnamed protein product [Microthlaspi erraticum]|uniref:Uncharacterized protein n=1 Tax=Microthlaspi erraticum TaxID=1685480 RepID=A0A6D2JXP9_9BRAS|nr:unnamed protein product [Microthlaspi erraticum]
MLSSYNCGELRVGQRSLEGPANGCVNLNWNLPSNSLCSMRRLVLQNLMSIHPAGVDLLLSKWTPAAQGLMMGLIPMSRSFTSPSLIVPVPSLQRRCWQGLVHISQHWAPDLSSLDLEEE